MQYSVQIESGGEEVVADCPELGLSATGFSTTNALDRLRANIRFHLEMCPCSSLEEDDIEFDVN